MYVRVETPKRPVGLRDGCSVRRGRFPMFTAVTASLFCVNTLADWSTFKSAAGTVPNSHPHSRACIKSNTHSYADTQPHTITKRSTCRNASPTFTPSQIALHPVRVIRVYDATATTAYKVSHVQRRIFLNLLDFWLLQQLVGFTCPEIRGCTGMYCTAS